MQIRIFTLPITDTGAAQEEMNRFLRSKRVIECAQQLVNSEHGASWCFCIKYIEGTEPLNSAKHAVRSEKVDYKNLLNEQSFKIFTRLREIRKAIAQEDAVPAYAVCTDEELAKIAQLPELSKKSLLSVKGFGEKKMAKYGDQFIQQLKLSRINETGE